MSYQLVTIANGNEILDFLHRRADYDTMPRPDLILLDLNLTGKDGREVLAEIKTHPQFRRIPIVVLATSSDQADVFHSYAHQGNSYVLKASDLDRLADIVKRIEDFWLGIVTLPVE